MIDQGETVGDFPLDWRELERESHSFLSSHQLRRKPVSLPGGVNFMTNEYVGCWEADDGTPAMLETALWMRGEERMMGVTFPRARDGSPDERDKLCWSWTEVRVALGYGDGEP